MTDKAIEAGARAIYENWANYPACSNSDPWSEICEHRSGQADDFRRKAKACIEAAIASGALVPASAVAEMRELCAKVADRAAERDAAWAEKYPDESRRCDERELRAKTIAAAIRQLDIAPACGEYVVVPREPTREMLRAVQATNNDYFQDHWKAALNAATRTGGGE